MAGLRPRHVWLSSTSIAILVVQDKLDYPVSETGLFGFAGLKRWTYLTPSPVFLSSLSPTLKNNCEGTPKTSISDFLVPPWNLGVLG
jgi:hypothetical protein